MASMSSLRRVAEAIEAFVSDIVRRSKDVEALIAALPTKGGSEGRVRSCQPPLCFSD
jgi:hypothetical protein